jgi:pyruvate-ferredoxin/flavodoxin oxidoreductase
MKDEKQQAKYPGIRSAMDGNTAVIMCEREASDAAGAYPITPSTQMGEYWAEAAAAGHINISDRPLIFVEPEGEHAAAAVTAGMAMTGLRACNFSSGQGIAYMHESLYAAVGKRLTYVLNMGCRAMTKASLNVHAGHDDYHAVDDTGFFQVFGKDVQSTCDLNVIAHRIAELALNPGIVGQDGFLTTHLIESLHLPERSLIEAYLGRPEDIIESPTPAQRMVYGDTRPRIPELWNVDNPVMAGVVQNQDAYMQSVAAQRPFYFDHIEALTEQAMAEYGDLTGRRYERVMSYRAEDADYLLLGQGSMISNAEAVVDHLRETRGLKIGVVDLVMFRPFPGDLLGTVLKGRKGVAVLERLDQPLAEDQPIMRELRATIGKCIENGAASKGSMPYPGYATYQKASDAPPLYSGSFGMGSRDLQPEALIAAVENMLPDGPRRKLFYLSIDFIHDRAYTPKQEIHQQAILENYPEIKDLAIRGSENPNLMPKGSTTVRIHSVGGWGAITTGKNLAMTLFDLLGYHIKANPKYGSEKKGQPTTYYLSAAPEPIRINSEYFYVDVVLSPDPNVFKHSNPLAGLKKGGVFILQSEHTQPEDVWKEIPSPFQQTIIDNDIRVFYLDAFKVAREEASDVELQFRMQGNVFQGAFFAASPMIEESGLTDESLFDAIETQLRHKFGAKGDRVVQDNLRVVQRGFMEVNELEDKRVSDAADVTMRREALLPPPLKDAPTSQDQSTDIHRFWEQTGHFYSTGQGGDNLADPFIGQSLVPAATGVFRDMTAIRFEHPQWDPQKCTACGKCYSVCPDSAIPGLVNAPDEIFETVVNRVESASAPTQQLRKALRTTDRVLRSLLDEAGESANVGTLTETAIDKTLDECDLVGEDLTTLQTEFSSFKQALNGFQFSVTKPFYTLNEKKTQGSGGLLSITIDPYTCKGCMECVEVCDDDALLPVPQTPESVEELRQHWDFWESLPNTRGDFIRIDDIDEGIGALEQLLLDKTVYKSMVGGDGACLGCGEKTVMHLFTATNDALMMPRVAKFIDKLDGLIAQLEKHVRLKLASYINVGDVEGIDQAIGELSETDLTLSALTGAMDEKGAAPSIDADWLKHVSQLVKKLQNLRWRYTAGTTGRGRSSMGMVNSTGCSSVWGSTFPLNPYPFPWANHLFQDSPSMALGLFEGHMAKMADGFRAVRQAELELDGTYKPDEHDSFFTYFDWKQFSEEEFALCPPVVVVGGDGALYDIGFQNLSRMLMTGKPIKVVALDTQVYSNTGGQACTSGFFGQVSDMAQYGKAIHGKEEIRKEIGLIGMAHRTSYIHQGSIANVAHLMEGFIEGLNSTCPAIFNVYCACMPEHGIADDSGVLQGRLALESRAYPIFSYDPDRGVTPSECLNLEGNPEIDQAWPSYVLEYTDEQGHAGSMELPFTFADFALTEGRFRKHFRMVPADAWNDSMVPVAEFLELEPEDREDRFPYIWAVDKKNRLIRVIVATEVVRACEERQEFWAILKEMARHTEPVDTAEIEQKLRVEVVQKLASGLLELAGGNAGGGPVDAVAIPAPSDASTADGSEADSAPVSNNGYLAPYIDSSECTACDECIGINKKVFAYNARKQAFIVDPKVGSYKDLVRAAEKCTAQCIHPGLPADHSERGVEKLIARAKKYN